MSGTLIAQAVMFLSIPILTRLYTPSEFGLYALSITIISILGGVSSLKYDQAIMLPKFNKDAQALLFLSLIITLSTSLLSLIVIILLEDVLVNYFNNMEYIIYLLPIGILVTGLSQILTAYSSRNQFYKQISLSRVLNSVSNVSIQGSSKFFFNVNGLLEGKILADILSLLFLVKYHYKKNTIQLLSISKKRMIVISKKHDNFPRYQSVTSFFNAISQSLPIILFTALYSAEVAGLYSLTVRALAAPMGMITSSTREVFYQKVSKMFANNEDIFQFYKKTTLNLFKIFLIPFFLIIFFGEFLFSFVFGNEWSESGVYAQIYIFWLFSGFINMPSVVSFAILGLQKIQMKLEIYSLFLRFFAIIIGFYLFHSSYASLALFTLSSMSINIYIILFVYKKLKYDSQNRNKNEF